MTAGIFVTGTDTDVGKTLVSRAIIRGLRNRGVRAVGMKPIASGGRPTQHGLRNDDALALQEVSDLADYDVVNPICFEPAIAPHIGAALASAPISLETIEQAWARLCEHSNFIVVEGAGGYRVPLSIDGPTMAEIPKRLELDVVMVVAIRLGCLNHALLTAEAIRADGPRLAGWVANCLDDSAEFTEEQIAALTSMLKAPLLGRIPRLAAAPSAEEILSHLDLDPLYSRLPGHGSDEELPPSPPEAPY